MAEKKSYFAIIPANVRYDDELSANAKLLYGEITALCNEKGYCWASNDYFSQLYGKSKYTVSRWISSLSQKGYIQSEISKEDGNMRMLTPLLTKNATLLTKTAIGIDENRNTPIDENRKQNNTLLNNTVNSSSYIESSNSNREEYKKNKGKPHTPKKSYGKYKNVLLSDDEYKLLIEQYGNPEQLIERLDRYKEKSGKKYNSDYIAITDWVVEALKEDKEKKAKKKPEIDSTYDIEEINRRAMLNEDLDEIYNSI